MSEKIAPDGNIEFENTEMQPDILPVSVPEQERIRTLEEKIQELVAKNEALEEEIRAKKPVQYSGQGGSPYSGAVSQPTKRKKIGEWISDYGGVVSIVTLGAAVIGIMAFSQIPGTEQKRINGGYYDFAGEIHGRRIECTSDLSRERNNSKLILDVENEGRPVKYLDLNCDLHVDEVRINGNRIHLMENTDAYNRRQAEFSGYLTDIVDAKKELAGDVQ
jgi:hypothetical protein